MMPLVKINANVESLNNIPQVRKFLDELEYFASDRIRDYIEKITKPTSNIPPTSFNITWEPRKRGIEKISWPENLTAPMLNLGTLCVGE